jgi:hypothetical protein
MKTTSSEWTASKSTIYITDNGSLLCGEHLGASAYWTGRDISGQPIEPVTESLNESWVSMGLTPRCESCGKEFDA